MRSNGFVKIVAQHPPKGAAIQLTAILGTQSGHTSTNIPVNKRQVCSYSHKNMAGLTFCIDSD